MKLSCSLLLATLCLLGCEYPRITLGTRASLDGAVADAQPRGDRDADESDDDNDNENDERARPCGDETQCTEVDFPFCDEDRDRCVECLSNADCTAPEVCESDGECDRPE